MSRMSVGLTALAVLAALILWGLLAPDSFEIKWVTASAMEPPEREKTPAIDGHSSEESKAADQADAHDADKHEEEAEAPRRVSHNAEGQTIVTLDAATQSRIGLKTDTPKSATFSTSMRAYGRLIEDPTASFSVRAPMTGFLRESSESKWPALGSKIAEGTKIGAVEPRFTAAERFDLTTRAMDARAEVEELQASLRATRASLESKRRLNSGDHVVSDRAIEEAEAMVKGEEARLGAAIKKAEICEAQADLKGSAATAVPLVVPAGGEVVEVMARPGETTESGQALLRVADLEHLIARVELPIGETKVGQASSAQVSLPGEAGKPIAARIIGPAPSVPPGVGGQSLLLALDAGKSSLRPGMAVVAELTLAGEASTGVRIPPPAVVQYGGATWVYIQESPTEFLRRRISDSRPIEDGFFVTDVTADEHVVVSGCGAILSEELKSLAAEEEE